MVSGVVCAILTSVAPASGREWVEPPQPVPLFDERPAWPESHPALCSDRRPVCVHARTEAEAAKLGQALSSLERAHARVAHVLDWPAPLPDYGKGSNDAFDLYLVREGTPWASRPDPVWIDFPGPRASAFGVVDVRQHGSCVLDYSIAASFARAGVYGVDAAANDALANASAAYIASLVEPCSVAYLPGIDDFQARPQLSVSSPEHDGGRSALLFPWFVQETRGHGAPVGLLHALWSLSVQPSPRDPAVLQNEPDFIDSVGIVAEDRREKLADLWLDFAVARAFVGNRDDGVRLPSSRYLGAAGAVRFEWSVDYGSLPRRLAPKEPIEPGGASYVYLSLDGMPEGAGLAFRADWESPDVFRFALVIVDREGQVVARHDPVSPERGTSVERNLEVLKGGAGVIVVAANTGPVLRDIAFDPDNYPYTARSYTVSLFATQAP